MGFKAATLVSVFFFLLSFAAAEAIPQTDYDVIIVGGGPAGLSAISGVSRVRRTALLFDNQHYRNGVTREMHDVIGNDGTPPDVFRGLARSQIEKYDTAHFVNETVASIVPIEGDFSSFTVTDGTGKNYTARKIVLGTGLKDDLPATPGLRENFGKGIYWCPWCDGYEHRDQPIGILGSLVDVVGTTLEIHTQQSDIVAFVNGTDTPDVEATLASNRGDNWRDQLNAWNVTIDNRTISSIDRLQDGGKNRDEEHDRQFDKFRINFTTGKPVERNAFITNFGTSQASSPPTDMGLEMEGIYVKTAASTRTSLTGVFAAGDMKSDGATNVPNAMFSGKRAAVYLHVELSKEETTSKISKRSNLSARELEKEAMRAIGDDLASEWERAQAFQ
ncbi:hypothetical protein N7470_002065 [Penicillium chermesinum]|nr:hypothetical protein N7470_002065 [Penicillium chermesinum]